MLIKMPIGFMAVIIAAPALAEDFQRSLSQNGIRFNVTASQTAGKSSVTIAPFGLSATTTAISEDIEGEVVGAEVADIDGDKDPELYIYTASGGEPKVGGTLAYVAHKKERLVRIFVPSIGQDKKHNAGYVGGDQNSVSGNAFVTRFMIYDGFGGELRPTGKWRQLAYKLKPARLGWTMVLEKVEEF